MTGNKADIYNTMLLHLYKKNDFFLLNISKMEINSHITHLFAIRDIILLNKGIIYGGFNRDMILYLNQKYKPASERTQPIDINLVISYDNYKKMTTQLSHEREYVLTKESIEGHSFKEDRSGNLRLKERLTITGGPKPIILDITILVAIKDNAKYDQSIMLQSFFRDIPAEFDVNRLALTSEGLRFIRLDGDLSENTDQLTYVERHIKSKIAVLLTAITCIKDNRISKMIKKGFKILSNDESIRWIERSGTETIECLACYKKLTYKWLPVQNIFNYECKCALQYVCAEECHFKPDDIDGSCLKKLKNKCIYCRKKNNDYPFQE